MSKSILVIDTPCNCDECKIANEDDYITDGEPCRYKRLYSCMFEPEHFDEDGDNYTDFLNEYILEERKPDWCPLRKLPEKKGETKTLSEEYNNEKNLIAKGYNLCISHILGEELPNF